VLFRLPSVRGLGRPGGTIKTPELGYTPQTMNNKAQVGLV
jgi:hypothetical protein